MTFSDGVNQHCKFPGTPLAGTENSFSTQIVTQPGVEPETEIISGVPEPGFRPNSTHHHLLFSGSFHPAGGGGGFHLSSRPPAADLPQLL